MGDRGKTWAFLVGLAILLLAVYSQVRNHEFVEFDDGPYLTDNATVQQGLTMAGVRMAFDGTHGALWHPLTTFSHMLDCELLGMDAGMHHLESAVIHVVNSILLYFVLMALLGHRGAASFATAVFALHPLRVESVAWAAERKDVLVALFWMLTLLAYVRYVRRPGAGTYLTVAAAHAMGLMSKSMAVTMPAVLLLLDLWPLRRWRPGGETIDGEEPHVPSQPRPLGRLVVEKLPLLGLTLVASVFTIIAQRGGGAMAPLGELPVPARIANGLIGYVSYLRLLVWPAGLCVFYPHTWRVHSGEPAVVAWTAAGAGLIVVALTIVAAWQLRRRPWLLIGWLWFLGVAVPVIGLVQVGDQGWADRFTYLPSIGIIIAVTWSLRELVLARPAWRRCVLVAAVALLAVYAVLTWRQLTYWKDTETLFERAVAETSRNDVALVNLGDVYMHRGDQRRAMELFREAAEANPGNYFAHFNIGTILGLQDKMAQAIPHFEMALRAKPDYALAHSNLGLALDTQGDLERARHHLEEAVRLDPGYAYAHNNLGHVLMQMGEDAAAAASFRAAIRLMPDHVTAHRDLAWVLATTAGEGLGDGAEAERLAKRALALTHSPDVVLLETLAAAHAAAGAFDEAVARQREALGMAEGERRRAASKRLALYRARRRFIRQP